MSLVGVYKGLIKSVISVCKKGQQMHLMAEKMLRKRSDFAIYSYLKDSEFTAVKRDAKVHTLCAKRYPFANRRYSKGVPLLLRNGI